MGGARKQDGRVAETAAGLVHEGQGRQVRRVAMGLVCRGRVLMLTLRRPRRPYKPASFYQFLRRLGYFPTETTKRATHGLDFEGSRTFKWNGSHRTKYIQSKKERETVSLEINRRSIIQGEHPAMPIFGAQVMAILVHLPQRALGVPSRQRVHSASGSERHTREAPPACVRRRRPAHIRSNPLVTAVCLPIRHQLT